MQKFEDEAISTPPSKSSNRQKGVATLRREGSSKNQQQRTLLGFLTKKSDVESSSPAALLSSPVGTAVNGGDCGRDGEVKGSGNGKRGGMTCSFFLLM